MNRRDLLIEIGTEELPPKALKGLSKAFTQEITQALQKADLYFSNMHAYAAPRRLGLLVNNLDERQPDKQVERRGPALSAAFKDDGTPTSAALGFAKSCGVDVNELGTEKTDKGAWLIHSSRQTGQATAKLLADMVRTALDKLPIPKRMRWGNLSAEFVRPVHWAVLLFGDEVIEAEILAVRTGRLTRGHRFHHPDTLYIGEPQAYAALLESQGHVIADFAARREAVRGQVLEAAAKLGGTAVIDENLLDEVTSMVEWPKALSGNFEARYLAVPAEALISTMKANQKYFHLVDAQGKLLPHFITVANIDSRDIDAVRAGNERVIRPRLADAEFFWNQDRKQPLESRLDKLKDVVFQKQLGTLYDKSMRVAHLAAEIAQLIGGDAALAERAGLLSKCDLMTLMVYEFTDLQGVMGRYYAAHDGEHADVAAALDEQYRPRFAGDQLPQTGTGRALAIADKLDTLVGIFAIGQIPTGNKDPFALRRAALGLLRIVIEGKLDIDLLQLIGLVERRLYVDLKTAPLVEEVFAFMMDRLRAYYAEAGVPAQVFEAVLALRPPKPLDFDRRVRAVSAFRELPQAESLAAANKRISNILRQAVEKKIAVRDSVNKQQLVSSQEQLLHDEIERLEASVTPLFAKGDYEPALKQLAALRDSVDAFFDDVMVMIDDTALRDNRLALLNRLRNLFLHVADLSCLSV